MKNPHVMSYAVLGAAILARRVVRHMRAYDLRDKVALVTGGSRGLGLLIARELVARGARVAICARSQVQLDRARRDLEQRGGPVLAVACDVTSQSEISSLIALVTEQLGPIDVLVNNAGVIQVGPAELMELSDYDQAASAPRARRAATVSPRWRRRS